MHVLSRQDARRIAVRAQLLDKARPASLHEVVDGLTLLQVDQTAAVAPSADLVLWSRLGSAYDRDELTRALADRSLIELRSMIRPSKDLALYRADMAEWPGTGTVSGWLLAEQRWLTANDGCRRDILARLDEAGPLSAKELPDTCVQQWKSSGWNNNRNVTLMLELMERTGDVAVAGRDRAGRLWDLAERVYPPGPTVPAAEARRRRSERRLRSLGIARARGQECPVEPWDVGDAGEPAVIEGVRGEWRVDPSALEQLTSGQRFAGRAAILSPLDRLVHDRKRMVDIFEFDYQLEMFKPAAKRRWGYYALPILYGDCLVGKIDARADRKAGVLIVNAIHEDEPFTKTMTAAVDRELKSLARCLGLSIR